MKKKVLAALIAVMSCTGAFSVPVNSFAASAEKTASEQTSEKGSVLQAYADEISDLMLRSRIAGYAFVRDDKVVITYSAYEDKIKTYIDEKGYDKSIFVYEAGKNVATEKESALKPVAEDINEYMRSNGISGFTYVQEVDGVEKIFISYDGFFDKIKAYVTGKGIDENIVVYQQSHDDVIVSAAVSGVINNDGTFNIADVDISGVMDLSEFELKETVVSENVNGDANCDGDVNMSDAVIIMQSLANPAKYGVNGTDENHITEQGKINGDIAGNNDGITNADALAIQKKLLGIKDDIEQPATIQTPPKNNSYLFDSYDDLAEALTKADSFKTADSDSYGELFNNTVSAFENKDITLYVPALNGKECELMNKEGFSNITLLTSELYNLPWIWYHCKADNSDIDIKLAYHSIIENDALNSAKTYYDILKLIAPEAPNPDNYTEFESYQKIYESKISLANDKNVDAMISEIKDSNKVYVMFNYDGMLVSIYADQNALTEEFWNSFSLNNLIWKLGKTDNDKSIDNSAIAGKIFAYEKEGAGGYCTLSFNENGRFLYYPGRLSSYMSGGDWKIDGDTVSLIGMVDKTIYLKITDDTLVYIAEGSDEFPYMEIKDGEKFAIYRPEISSDKFQLNSRYSEYGLGDPKVELNLIASELPEFCYVENVRLYDEDDNFIGMMSPAMDADIWSYLVDCNVTEECSKTYYTLTKIRCGAKNYLDDVRSEITVNFKVAPAP